MINAESLILFRKGSVMVTPHGACLTREAITEIADVTAANATLFANGLEDGETVRSSCGPLTTPPTEKRRTP